MTDDEIHRCAGCGLFIRRSTLGHLWVTAGIPSAVCSESKRGDAWRERSRLAGHMPKHQPTEQATL